MINNNSEDAMIRLLAHLWVAIPVVLLIIAYWALSGKKKTGIDVIDDILDQWIKPANLINDDFF